MEGSSEGPGGEGGKKKSRKRRNEERLQELRKLGEDREWVVSMTGKKTGGKRKGLKENGKEEGEEGNDGKRLRAWKRVREGRKNVQKGCIELR